MIILIVDDCDDLIEVIKEYCYSAFGREINFIVATNGQEGLELYRSNIVDLIITDYNMPLMSGEEMTRQIREDDIETPVLLMSADTSQCEDPSLFDDLIDKCEESKIWVEILRYITVMNT